MANAVMKAFPVVHTWGRNSLEANSFAVYRIVSAGVVMATFPAGTGREWVQIRDRAGGPLNQTVALPVKDPFHVARALLLSVELLADRDD